MRIEQNSVVQDVTHHLPVAMCTGGGGPDLGSGGLNSD
jgi:hypothetical protein